MQTTKSSTKYHPQENNLEFDMHGLQRDYSEDFQIVIRPEGDTKPKSLIIWR